MKVRTLAATISPSLVVAALAMVWAVASPLAAPCASAVPLEQIASAPSETAAFVARINSIRASQGLNTLSVDGNLTGIAQDWAVNMASQDSIFHRVDLRDGVTSLWRRLGENVGVGPSVEQLMDAFVASPGHHKNVVDPVFTHIGVGTVRTSDGMLYTAHEFAAIEGAAPPVTAPPVTTAPAPKPAPPATTPRVTAPPTTVAPTTTTTTEPPTMVTRTPSTGTQHKLQDGRGQNQQQQQRKNQGRCRPHGAATLLAAAIVAE